MTVKVPPHRPTAGELDAARKLGLPTSDGYVEAMLDLVHRARAQGQNTEALNILSSLTLVRPDERRLYHALAMLYAELGRPADAQTCHAEAARLAAEKAP